MFDFTHKKRPDLIQLVLLIAVVCLALGAITPSASAVDYEDLTYSSGGDPVFGSGSLTGSLKSAYMADGTYLEFYLSTYSNFGALRGGTLSEMANVAHYNDLTGPTLNHAPNCAVFRGYGATDINERFHAMVEWIISYTNIDSNSSCIFYAYGGEVYFFVYNLPTLDGLTYDYLYPVDSLDLSLTAFAPDDPAGMYVLSLDGSLLDTTYTVGINRYTDEFKYLIDSYAYTDGSGSYTFTGSRSLTLPIYYNSFTNMPYSYELSVNVNDENGYLDTRYLVYWSDLGGLYDTVPEPLNPTPKPTPTQTFVPTVPLPSDIIPHPDDLNNTVNITGWYQDQGFEGNNITAPIYSGIRGWFNENLIPVIDFFLTPTNYVATVISDSSETSTDGISYITEELGSYAAPFNTVGAYVVRLVPEVVWLVVFAALSIGYVILLIRVSTGSIKDTIGRFLGGGK